MDTRPTLSILLFGATGQVGHELRLTLASFGSVRAPDRDTVDLTAVDDLRQAVEEYEPDLVVNAAAYTEVDEAERNAETAAAVNARAPRVLAEASREVGAWLVHYSTDYVFDGTKTIPYREEDAPDPINVYGRTKWEGEKAVQETGRQFLILRTSWVYSPRRSNFFRTMLRLADENERLTVVDDQIGTPTCAGWIADATATVLRRLLETAPVERPSGVYHLAAGGQTSWYGFARAIFARFGIEKVTVEPVSSEEYPTVAERPAYSVLTSRRVQSTFDLSIPTWTEQLAALQSRLNGSDGPGSQFS